MADIKQAIATAQQHTRRGQYGEAERIYRQILQVDPYHRETLELLGRLVHHQGRYPDALSIYQQGLMIEPGNARLHECQGLALKELKRFDEAIQAFERAIASDPSYGNVRLNLGNTFRALGQLDQSSAVYYGAIRENPKYAETYSNLGSVLQETKRYDEAIACFEKSIECKPDHASTYINMGNALMEMNQFARAEAAYRQALSLDESSRHALRGIGNALQAQRKHLEAIGYLEQALAQSPDNVGILNDLGIAHQDARQDAQSVAYFRKILAMEPNLHEVHNNLGNSLRDLGEREAGLACFQKALELNPNYATPHYNIGNYHRDRGHLDEALASYRRALEIRPDYAEAEFHESFIHLLRGDFQAGWPGYEARWRIKQMRGKEPNLPQPRWDGSALQGKRILLFTEQGFGDAFQFIRFAESVQQRGGEVLLECQPKLLRLLSSCAGIDRFIPRGERLPEFDVQCALMSVPWLLGTEADTIPNKPAYLFAETELVEQWRQRLAPYPGLKVAINWQGSPTFERDAVRSIPLEKYRPLATVPGVQLFSIQKGPGIEQLEPWSGELTIVNLGPDMDTGRDGFIDTAAVMRNMDLVITSDTAVAHLAGALGVPVWVALNYIPDWRFLLKRADSPGYPSMRHFRQQAEDDWEPVFEEIRKALEELTRSTMRGL